MSVLANLGLSVQIVTVVVPVAVYFLILGLLNSRRRPQLLTGRQDFALLIAALSPLVVLPAMNFLEARLLTVAAVGAAAVGAVALLAPPGRTWVIYNLSVPVARSAISDVLRMLGLNCLPEGSGFRIAEQDARVEIGGFPLLRNVSIRVHGGSADLSRSFHQALSRRLAVIPAPTHLMAVSLLLVATAMLAAPLVLMASDVPEIVRIISDLLY
jgi:hypothetical protein